MIRRPPRSTQSRSSAASDVYKRQPIWFIRCDQYNDPTAHPVRPAGRVANPRSRRDAGYRANVGRANGPGTPGAPEKPEKPDRTAEPVSYTHLRAHETDSYLVC